MRSLALLVTVAVLAPPALAGGGPSAPETVVAEIAKGQTEALSVFEREITSWQIDYEVKSFGPGGELARHAKYTRRHHPDGLALATQLVVLDKTSNGGGQDVATAQNREYRFSLQKAPGSSAWVLGEAQRGGVEADTAAAPHSQAGAWFARHFFTADRRLYADVLRDPQFVVKSCGPAPANGDWVRVTGELPTGKDTSGKKPALKGWWDFDPKMGYCCRGSEVTSVYKGFSTVERHDYSLSLRDAGLVTLDSYKFTGHADYSGEIKNQESGEWTFNYRRDSVPESEFTLTAFGLPEPYFATPQRSYTWAYLAAGAVVAAGAAWLIRRSVRQRPA